jgi:hypothetical protein
MWVALRHEEAMMTPDWQQDDAEETALVRYIVVYVLVAWATLVIPLLLGHSVLIALLCVTPVGLAGVWLAAWQIFKKDANGDNDQEQSLPAYDWQKPD